MAVHGSAGAAKRLHKELKMIQRAGASKLGFTVALVEDSLHEWEVKMFGFDVKVRATHASTGNTGWGSTGMCMLRGHKRGVHPQSHDCGFKCLAWLD